ncbi:uncharacterized protein LOC123532592 [Mercenaria mercenaria]|uniref:uncharacterized protein LOC123532592 n=1 Tax=Mercenaria mercenaria TaxID=6596 RepID=UPI00234F975D|nr:uncharacterized protein LOC123532592 [Mercenaria mercenaria]
MFEAAYNEIELNIPFFLRLMEAIIGNSGNKRATIVMIYSMILNSRNNKVSAIQRMITTLAVRCHADNMLLSRLNKLHITMSAVSKGNIITEWGDNYDKRLKKSIADGNDGKLNGDNVDIFVTTNDIRMTNRSKDYHFFATDFTPFRVTPEDFMKNEYLVNYLENEMDPNINAGRFMPDASVFKDNIKLLVARDLITHLNFKWMDLVVPKHIDHPLQDIMSRKTTSFCLPILLKNEAKYEDCIQIMDSYEQQLQRWYRECGRIDDFKNCSIPVGGDKLTRVRLDGAKNLRLGAHTAQERFDNLCPVVVEMFHTQMDFLEKTMKKFFKKSSGRDVGTLYNLKTIIQRTSVNGNVKSRFKAHEEFALLVGKAYVLEAAMEHFGMDNWKVLLLEMYRRKT